MDLHVSGGERLDEMIAVWAQAGGGRMAREVAKRAAPEIGTVVHASFAAGQSPMGQTWKPLSCREGTPLRVSGALEASAIPQAIENRIGIASALPYSEVQNKGKKITATRAKALRFVCNGEVIFRKSVKVPARPFVPPSRSLPPEWDAKIEAAAKQVLGEVFQGDSTNYV